MDPASPIIPLPADAVAQIKSSIAITSLNIVVVELLENSLDAQSSRVDITLDYSRGNCVVEDDGLGIQPPEFKDGGGLGKLYHSSKHDSNIITYGSRGAFIASVAALSLVSITSHHYLYHSQNSLIINRSQVIARHIPAPSQQHINVYKHGTRVTVRDLFGNMPVRVKQRGEESTKVSGGGRDWDELRRLITSVVLAWPSPVTVVAKDETSGQKFQLRGQRRLDYLAKSQREENFVALVCNKLSQALFISSPDQSRWVSARASTPRIHIQGAISLEPAPTKTVQFLSLGIEPLYAQYGHGILYDEINQIFDSSSFGAEAESINPGTAEPKNGVDILQNKDIDFTTKELKGARKRLDRWPMFFIMIQFSDPVSHRIENATTDLVEDRRGSLTSVIELLRVMISEFLRSHHFRPKTTRHANGWQDRNPEKVEYMSQNDIRAKADSNTTTQYHKPRKLKRIGSPFDGWSRVKSGRPKPRDIVNEQFCEHEDLKPRENSNISAPSHPVGNISVYCKSGSDTNSPGLEYDNPTIAHNGNVIRPPFSDVINLEPETISSSSALESNILVSGRSETTGMLELVNWVNPINKREFLIDPRTGLVARPPKTERLTPRIQSNLDRGTQSNFPSMENLALSGITNSAAGSSTWIQAVLETWKNPVYCPREVCIPQVARDDFTNESRQLLRGNRNRCSQLDIDSAFQQSNASCGGQISKEGLRYAEVISQVDKKFILIKMATNIVSSNYDKASSEMLVIVDQHAADERCRIEDFLKQVCGPLICDERLSNMASVQSAVLTVPLEPPISFVMSMREIQLLRTHSRHFASWGIIYNISSGLPPIHPNGEHKISVISLPPLIMERCKAVPRLLAELLRSEAWRCTEKGTEVGDLRTYTDDIGIVEKYPWLRRVHNCPSALVEMLNSRACRSAIMFNDELSLDQCTDLISRLADCAFPFQCAHGRPSMVPLVNLQSFLEESLSNARADVQYEEHFGAALKRWKHERSGVTRD